MQIQDHSERTFVKQPSGEWLRKSQSIAKLNSGKPPQFDKNPISASLTRQIFEPK